MRNPTGLLCLLATAACGANLAQATPDATQEPDAPAAFSEAPHGNVPQVVSNGGAVLAAPNVVPIFFSQGEDATTKAQLEAFLAQIAGSSYWAATTAEYGPGPLTLRTEAVSDDPAPPTDDDLQTWPAAQFPNPDPNTIYTVFLPPGYLLTTGNAKSCRDFGAY